MNSRDLLLDSQTGSMDREIEELYDLLSAKDLDFNALKDSIFENSFKGVEVDEEERSEILNYLERLDISKENKEIEEEYEEIEKLELGLI